MKIITHYDTKILENWRIGSALLTAIFLILINFTPRTYGADAPILSIQAPGTVVVGEDFKISIEVLNASGGLVNDSRELSINIFNTDTSEKRTIRLKNGQAEEKVTLQKVGASLIEVIDPLDSTFVRYKPLNALDRPWRKK